MILPSEQVSESKRVSAQMLIHPDAKVVQGHPGDQGDHLASHQRRLRSRLLFSWELRFAETIDHDVQCYQKGIHTDHRLKTKGSWCRNWRHRTGFDALSPKQSKPPSPSSCARHWVTRYGWSQQCRACRCPSNAPLASWLLTRSTRPSIPD